jgi:hypothetical protein
VSRRTLRYHILDSDIVFQLSRDVDLGRLNLICILFGCVVESYLVGVVVMTAVRGLEVHLLATLVVTLAVLTATVNMLGVVCVAR